MKVSVEKPGTPADILEHHGTKGMKWGVRKAAKAVAGSHRTSKEFAQKFPTATSRGKEIRRARMAVNKNVKAIDRAKTPAAHKKAADIYLKNPDRATAKRLTQGEKVTVAVLAGVFGVTGLVPAAVGGALAGQRIHRSVIERRQARGAYN